MRDNLQQELAKELGSKSIFLYQRLNSLEEKAAFDYFSKKLDKKMSNVIVLHNKTVEVDKREKLRHLMRGMYDFKFGASTQTFIQKLDKITSEPEAYHLYKRRDLESKIDKLAIEKLRFARLVFNVT